MDTSICENPIIPNFNSSENRTIPSVVSFEDNYTKVGPSAYQNISNLPNSTFYYVNRVIGRYRTPKFKKEQKQFAYEFGFDKNNRIMVKLPKTPRFEEQLLYPEQISAFVLDELVSNGKKCIKNQELTDVVIAVPEKFNDFQRRATMDAAKIAGLNTLAVISEPIAAAIHYAVQNEKTEEEIVLVYDFGGGTLDVTLVKIDQCEFTVLSTAGDSKCGGHDIDQKLFDYVVNQMEDRKFSFDRYNPRDKARLMELVEEVKMKLSFIPSHSFSYSNPETNESIELTISQATIGHIVEEMKEKLTKPIDEVIEQAQKRYCFPDEMIEKMTILPVGGSSRIPAVQKMIMEHLHRLDEQLNKTISLDESIAEGAAIYGAVLKNYKIPQLPGDQKLKIQEVTPFPIYIKTTCTPVLAIEKNTPKPATSKYQAFTNNNPNGECNIEIFEGDDPDDCAYDDNKFALKYEPREDGKPVRIFAKVESKEGTINVFGIVSDEEPKEDQENIAQGQNGYILRKEISATKHASFSNDDITTMKNLMFNTLKPSQQPEQKEPYNLKLYKFIEKVASQVKGPKARKEFSQFRQSIKKDYIRDDLTHEEYQQIFLKIEEKVQQYIKDKYIRPEGFDPNYQYP